MAEKRAWIKKPHYQVISCKDLDRILFDLRKAHYAEIVPSDRVQKLCEHIMFLLDAYNECIDRMKKLKGQKHA